MSSSYVDVLGYVSGRMLGWSMLGTLFNIRLTRGDVTVFIIDHLGMFQKRVLKVDVSNCYEYKYNAIPSIAIRHFERNNFPNSKRIESKLLKVGIYFLFYNSQS